MIKYYLMAGALVVASLGGYKVTDWHWQSKWNSHMMADAQANEKAAADALNQQRELITELEKVQNNAKAMQDKYDADRIAANDVAERLREQLNRIKASAKTDNSSTISISAASATDRIVLANVLERADTAAGILADYADRNRQAVINCVNEYEVVRVRLNAKVD